MRTNILPIVLPKPLYKELERRAYAQERDPLQHARWLLRQALTAEQKTEPAPAGPGEAA